MRKTVSGIPKLKLFLRGWGVRRKELIASLSVQLRTVDSGTLHSVDSCTQWTVDRFAQWVDQLLVNGSFSLYSLYEKPIDNSPIALAHFCLYGFIY